MLSLVYRWRFGGLVVGVRMLVVMLVMIGGLAVALPYLKRLQAIGSAPQPDPGIARVAKPSPKPAGPSVGGDIVVYKWRDANGTIHFESSSPPAGVAAQRVNMGKRVEKSKLKSTVADSIKKRVESVLPDNPLATYLPGGSEELMDRLDDVLGSMEERKQNLDALKGEL